MTSTHIFRERLYELIKSSGKSTNQVEKEIGYPRNALHSYRDGRIPSAKRILELSEYFCVTPEYLMGVNTIYSRIKIEELFNNFQYNEKLRMYKLCNDWLIKISEIER